MSWMLYKTYSNFKFYVILGKYIISMARNLNKVYEFLIDKW